MAGSSPAKKSKDDIPADIQGTVDEIDNIQTAIDNLNEQASEEILRIERHYSKLRLPYYDKRCELLRNIPEFWFGTFMNHPKLSAYITEDDEPCLRYLTDVQIKDADEILYGYQITLEFAANPYFENRTLTISQGVGEHASAVFSGTGIQWKDGKDLTGISSQAGEKRKLTMESFFSWFLDTGSPESSEIAEIIRDDIWLNPLRYFLLPKIEVESDAEDDDDEGDEEHDDDEEDNDEMEEE